MNRGLSNGLHVLITAETFWGIFKKFLMCVIDVLYRVDMLLGLTGGLGFMVGGTFFYIGNEFFSLVDNYGRLQLPLPKQVKKNIATG
ncbi:phage holin family protein [Paenibacillus sp. FSL K6-0276]|uniref:phage holin family protein n=1 Tax=Paenibacillus sp. FSL K6-0276 TaxID=2921450 RepID=UPI0030EC24FB